MHGGFDNLLQLLNQPEMFGTAGPTPKVPGSLERTTTTSRVGSITPKLKIRPHLEDISPTETAKSFPLY